MQNKPEMRVSGLLPYLRRAMQAITVETKRTTPNVIVARYSSMSVPDS